MGHSSFLDSHVSIDCESMLRTMPSAQVTISHATPLPPSNTSSSARTHSNSHPSPSDQYRTPRSSHSSTPTHRRIPTPRPCLRHVRAFADKSERGAILDSLPDMSKDPRLPTDASWQSSGKSFLRFVPSILRAALESQPSQDWMDLIAKLLAPRARRNVLLAAVSVSLLLLFALISLSGLRCSTGLPPRVLPPTQLIHSSPAPPMSAAQVGIIVATDSVGEWTDALMYSQALQRRGISASPHYVVVQGTSSSGLEQTRVVLHVESIHSSWPSWVRTVTYYLPFLYSLAPPTFLPTVRSDSPSRPQHWLMLNPELPPNPADWRSIDLVLCKTMHALSLMQAYRLKHNLNMELLYTRHSSVDIRSPSVPKDYSKFLHIGGKSWRKNTLRLLQVWLEHPEYPHLTIVTTRPEVLRLYAEHTRGGTLVPSNLELHESLKSEMLIYLANHIGVHVCPSSTEGYGHYINEARAVGACIITTDIAPMNEFVGEDSGILIKVNSTYTDGYLGVRAGKITNADIERAIEATIRLPLEERARRGRAARRRYEEDAQYFSDKVYEAARRYARPVH